MKLCDWVIIDSGGVKCGKPATHMIDFHERGKYLPVCETHFQFEKRLRKDNA